MLRLQLRFYLEGLLRGWMMVQEEHLCVKTSFYLLLPRLVLLKDGFVLAFDLLPRGVL